MEELCKQDGGVKVYETVKVPPAAYDATGRLITGEARRIEAGVLAQTVRSVYLIERREDVIKAGNPSSGALSEGRLLRHVTTVRRIADGKVLGVETTYGRTGGSFTLNHPSHNFCPKPRPDPGLEQAVFVRGE
jgi:hypothetical protein